MAGTYDENLKELFDLTGMKNSYVEMNTAIIQQMQTGFFQAIDRNISVDSYIEEQRQQIGEILKNRFSEMVKHYEDFVRESIPYEKVENDIYFPLYKETFMESEVKELLEFYRSPIGKKSIEVEQKIIQQAVESFAEKYDQIIIDFIKNEIDENLKIVKKEIEEQGIN